MHPVGTTHALCARKVLCRLQMSYKALRTEHEPRVTNLYGFSSAKKMASVLVRTDEGFRLYNKVILHSAHRQTCRCRYLCCPTAGLDVWQQCSLTCICFAGLQGAAEIVLKSATRVLNNEGVAVPLGADQRAELEATITQVRKLPMDLAL